MKLYSIRRIRLLNTYRIVIIEVIEVIIEDRLFFFVPT